MSTKDELCSKVIIKETSKLHKLINLSCLLGCFTTSLAVLSENRIRRVVGREAILLYKL